ncbi:MAG: hypothetical protein ACE5IL_16685 [Myxococcota bacterium]
MGETAPPVRRSFVQAHEIPGLLVGALRGRPEALRRILGARRGGRYGALLLLAAALVATPPHQIPWLAGLWIALAVGSWRLQRPRDLGLRQVLRASQWTAAPLVALATPLRAVDGMGPVDASGVAVSLALALSTLLLHRHLGRAAGPAGGRA